MAITTSGLYGPTLVKAWEDTMGYSLETNGVSKAMLCTDAYTPSFWSHDFRNDVSNEVTGSGYTSGGKDVTNEVLAATSTLGGYVYFDHDDVQWDALTAVDIMAMVGYIDVGSVATDQLIYLLDFETAVDVDAGTLLVQIASTGVWRQFLTPA